MFKKILIANRGEIAVRIIRACRDLRISPVAVFSEADSTSLHVRLCDEACLIGPAPSVESYLRIDRIIEAARKTDCDAIHPGYGFLAENPDFAEEANKAGLVFIGPSAEAMRAMGSKTAARKTAIAAGVPIVPGTADSLASYEEAKTIAQQIGYPVMLKAAAGGGGKGMRLVRSETELLSAFETAQSESESAFGNSEVYLEKAIERPRHIEIQIFGDNHGNYVHLGERECSIQRRHQKVIEECPSPIVEPGLRNRMGEAALKIARAVGYVNAGTVEFLVSDATREFYFLEVNTRLQVEHPVTELVTGFDLVREQIKVANNETLSFRQSDVGWNGHAIECRIYAEDPENNFLPSPGAIRYVRVPSGPGVRDDSGVTSGSTVSIHYDPLLSKLAVWGHDRREAIERLRRALDEYLIAGIETTVPFFRELVRDQEFIAAKLDTGFIDRFFSRRQTFEPDVTRRDMAAVIAAIQFMKKRKRLAPADSVAVESRWKLAGREALHNNRGRKRLQNNDKDKSSR